MADCTKGWAERCAGARSLKCTCECGGANHGHSGQRTRQRRTSGGEDGFIVGYVDTRDVFIGTAWLDPAPSQGIVNHSPDGFAWGYGGSGPSQLALAILLELSTRAYAAARYQDFKFKVISAQDKDTDLKIPVSTVREWMAANPV